MGGEELELVEEAPAVHRRRPTMDLENGWRFLPLPRLRGRAGVGAWSHDPALDVPAVGALVAEFFRSRQRDVAKQLGVELGQLGRLAAEILDEQVAGSGWIRAGKGEPPAVAIQTHAVDASLTADDDPRSPILDGGCVDERGASPGGLRVDFLSVC